MTDPNTSVSRTDLQWSVPGEKEVERPGEVGRGNGSGEVDKGGVSRCVGWMHVLE